MCGLKCEREVVVRKLDISVFLIPGKDVKNGDERPATPSTASWKSIRW